MLVNMQLNGWAVLQLQTPFSDTQERLKIDSKYGYVKIFLNNAGISNDYSKENVDDREDAQHANQNTRI
ncbi:hypothetical protein PPTG_25013 [Phytophthora nicotianae INRA-310]|uniref:Uncharacterized protein n=1 Tax=Phytophthora nicotianae (strain INRA-310) TaxID=761204 RepID=W2PBG4_PHYN3|nr:hypothetical protein PPTG_25013 [Phytophthora nicotianae INRA-310]ETM97314.1 hypothetical protein PPTG_25013 [Phytophthora nicotianae INRA-310]